MTVFPIYPQNATLQFSWGTGRAVDLFPKPAAYNQGGMRIDRDFGYFVTESSHHQFDIFHRRLDVLRGCDFFDCLTRHAT